MTTKHTRCPKGHSWCDGGDYCVVSRHNIKLKALMDEINAEGMGDLMEDPRAEYWDYKYSPDWWSEKIMAENKCCCELDKYHECPRCELHGGSIHDHSEYCETHYYKRVG